MAKKDYQKLIKDLMSDLSLNQAQLAKRLEVGQSTISRWKGGTHPDPDQAARIDDLCLKTYEQSTDFLPALSVLSIVGRVGAGAEVMPEIEQVPPEGLYEVEIDFPVKKGARAFEVDGLSMHPRFKPGDVIVCSTPATEYEQAIGWEAAVQTTEGQRFIKEVERGSEPGTYDLVSHNAPTMRNIRVEWISRIDLIVPKSNWRRRDRVATSSARKELKLVGRR